MTPLLRRLLLLVLLAPLLLLPLLLPSTPAAAASAVPVTGRAGMVVSTHRDAARAGARILEQGGNAIDAAVATAFAVGVAQPFSAGLGGGAFALVRLADGRIRALDARETAPAAATRTMYVEPDVPENASVHGPLAVAVPAFVPGMLDLLERHGTMPLARVLAPAIELAEEGVEIGPYHARMAWFMSRRLSRERFPETWRIQLALFDRATENAATKNAGTGEAATASAVSPPPIGQRLVQKDLGQTLRLLAARGGSIFRDGPIAQAIVETVQAQGGLLVLDDLRSIRPKWREPVFGSYRGLRVASFPPPSSGGVVLVQALNVLEGFELAPLHPRSSSAIHLVAEAMKLAFADRAAYLGDSDFVDVPIEHLVSKRHAASQRARIDVEKATRIEGPGQLPDDAGTTHFSVTDAAGRAVALTMTINTPYGSGITVPGTGVILNNEMDDFAVARDTPNSYGLIDTRGANLVAPGKRPLSSMTPTILDRDGRVFMVTGSPGGPRIISTTLLTILDVVDWGMDPQAAVAAPRYHHQWEPDRLRLEPEIPDDVVRALEARGHVVERGSRRWSAAEVIVHDAERGVFLGGADPRSDGAAVGVEAGVGAGTGAAGSRDAKPDRLRDGPSSR